MKQKLTEIISLVADQYPLRLSEKDLEQNFSGLSILLRQSGLLVQSSHDLYANCDNCGQAHKVTPLDGNYYMNCAQDEAAPLERVDESELVCYRFDIEKLASLLNQSLTLQGKVSLQDEGMLWYLGEETTKGKTWHWYLFRSADLAKSSNKLSNLPKENPALIWLGESSHTEVTDSALISLLDVLEASGGQLVLKSAIKDKLRESAPTSLPEGLDLDEHIQLTQEGKRYFLLFGKGAGGVFSAKEAIRPLMANVIQHLYTIRHHEQNAKKSSEMAASGAMSESRNGKAITNAIKKINDLTNKHNRKAIIRQIAGYRYQLNPDLDCFRQTSP